MALISVPKQKPGLRLLVWASGESETPWLLAGDWQEVHENISRAFSENTVPSGEPSWILLGFSLLVLVILAAWAYYYYLYRQRSGTDSPSSASSSNPNTPTNVTSRQKRNWVRVPAGFDIQYTMLSSEAAHSPVLQKGRLIDISGGGCLLATKHQLKSGSKLKLLLAIPQVPEMVVTGRVVRLITHLTDLPVFLVGIQFEDGSHGFRDRINKWVFSRQQQLINKKHWVSRGLCLLCGNLIPKSVPGNVPYCNNCLIGEGESSPSDTEPRPSP